MLRAFFFQRAYRVCPVCGEYYYDMDTYSSRGYKGARYTTTVYYHPHRRCTYQEAYYPDYFGRGPKTKVHKWSVDIDPVEGELVDVFDERLIKKEYFYTRSGEVKVFSLKRPTPRGYRFVVSYGGKYYGFKEWRDANLFARQKAREVYLARK